MQVRSKEYTNRILYFILATIPLIFGARHPLIQGMYSFMILLVAGSWIILNFEQIRPVLLRRSTIPPALLIFFIYCTSISLPLFLMQILSPARFNVLSKASELAGVQDTVNSLSYYAPDTRFYAVYFLGLVLFFFFASIRFSNKKIVTTSLWIIAVIGMFEAAYGLLQVTVPSLGVLWLPANIGAEGAARGTIIYRNQYAAFMNMCWPLALVLGITLYKPIIKKFNLLRQKKGTVTFADRIMLAFQKGAFPFWAAAFMILAVIFSRSRGGIFVMVLLALFFLFLLPLSRRIKAVSGSFFLLFIITYGGMIGFHHVIERFFTFYDSAVARFTLWADSLTMLKEHMLTGIGMGSYKYVSPVYLQKVPGNVWYDFAHNEYIELAVELGIPALVILLAWMGWGITGLGRKVLAAERGSGSLLMVADGTILSIGCFCALAGFLLHAFVDFVWRLPANTFYAVTVLALLTSAGSLKEGKSA